MREREAVITLYDNPFSPFARKVRMVLWWKDLPFESIDALALSNLEALGGVNVRREVPALADGEIRVVNSSDIVAYLDHRYGAPLALPEVARHRVTARAWERFSDTVVDAIVHDISLWIWPTHHRNDSPPDGLIEAGHRDLGQVLTMLEEALAETDFFCGTVSIADVALFPHVASFRLLGLPPDPAAQPRVCAWLARMRELPFVRRDLDYVRAQAVGKFAGQESMPYESERVVWRGDRLEWLFANGFHDWWAAELAAGRVVVPRSI